MLPILYICLVMAGVAAFKPLNTRHTRVTQNCPVQPTISGVSVRTQDLVLHASKNGADEDGGVEPKYLIAVGVVIFGVLWDFFITHGGQPYLQHPPV